MAINISEFDEDVYFAANTAVSVSIFATLVLPPLVLCILCVLALIFAKDINKKLRVLLINIFAVEIGTWLRWTSSFLGFPLRFRALAGQNWLCSINISLSILSGIQKFPANALYAVTIYFFIKHGEKKLKWYVIIPCITLSWLVSVLTFGIMPYFSDFGAANSNGFCTTSADSILLRSSVPVGILISLICLAIVIVCSILTGLYVKRNTLEGSVAVKKAVAKVLTYLAISTTLSFVSGLLPAASAPIKEAARAKSGALGEIIVDYTIRILFIAHSIPTPIITIVLLKVIRVALKNIGKKVIGLCVKQQLDVTETFEMATISSSGQT